MESLMPNDKELFQRIDEVVHYIWDPIGVSHIPEARDEYHSYLTEIYARVKLGDKDKVIEYMKWVVTDQMGMSFNHDQSEQAVVTMLKWQNIIKNKG
jgi:hypothetical protein